MVKLYDPVSNKLFKKKKLNNNNKICGFSMFSLAKVYSVYDGMLQGSSSTIIWMLKLPFLQNYNISWLWISSRICPPLLKLIK